MGETVTIDNFGGRSDEYLRGFEAGTQANVAGKLIAERDAEIASLRAELAVNNELYAISQSDLVAVSLQYDAATAVIERLEAAARQDVEEHEASMVEIANMRKDLDTALERSRQDAEERERLREALDGLIGGATAEFNEKGAGGFALARLSDARAALACRSQGEKS